MSADPEQKQDLVRGSPSIAAVLFFLASLKLFLVSVFSSAALTFCTDYATGSEIPLVTSRRPFRPLRPCVMEARLSVRLASEPKNADSYGQTTRLRSLSHLSDEVDRHVHCFSLHEMRKKREHFARHATFQPR